MRFILARLLPCGRCMLNTGSFVFLSKKTSDTLVLLFFIVKNGDIAFRKWFMVSDTRGRQSVDRSRKGVVKSNTVTLKTLPAADCAIAILLLCRIRASDIDRHTIAERHYVLNQEITGSRARNTDRPRTASITCSICWTSVGGVRVIVCSRRTCSGVADPPRPPMTRVMDLQMV
ncbi:unnamed protein product (mitochondrion) [Plasmodiophora brassicae]|uniref:Uncharacterized protein n=1 Tax=Plasmodiophora brassicae TaxID=37360 RepID=A0A3P3Y9F2_PLABS|nr:unnamed protein product [Plasmodiophora brassicae]